MTPAANVALRVLAGLFGTSITVGTFLSAVKLVVVPRSGSQRITRFMFGNVRLLVARIAPPSRDFVVRDRWYSVYAPVSLVMMPFTWLFLLTMGFGLIPLGGPWSRVRRRPHHFGQLSPHARRGLRPLVP